MFKTEQENFWAQEFGDEYIDRNISKQLLASNIALFSNIFQKTQKINSIMEFGANVGMNINAIKNLLPEAEFSAVEINKNAYEELKKIDGIQAYNTSILEFNVENRYDFVFTKGVLIHINPEMLNEVYEKMYQASSRYICIAEYYNPSPISIPYRGHEDRLFKRDFAGEMLKKYDDLKLIDYRFVYKRDNNFSQDDITWFLMEKE
jgi:spore coat polysaccharide biosynthesis protein SpsF